MFDFLQKYEVSVYKSETIEAQLNFCQRDFIAFALLLGSDFGEDGEEKGVPSIGKVKGLQLVQELKSKGLDVLDR